MTNLNDIPDIFRESAEKRTKTETDIMAQKAANAISGLTDQYIAQVNQDLIALKQALETARQGSPDAYFQATHDVFSFKMHDMKGQGTTFGYPLLTEIGTYACNYLRYKSDMTLADLDKLTLLVNDIECVLTQNLTGDGGDMGAQIRSHLADDAT